MRKFTWPQLVLVGYFIFLALLMLFVPACLATTQVTPLPTPVPVPTPVQPPPPSVLPLHNDAGYFADSNGQRWYWKGATDFLLLKLELDGQDIGPILDQRQAAGANLVRVFSMCWNIARFNPATYGEQYWNAVDNLLTKLAARGMYAEITVFADAQLVMPGLAAQQAHWQRFKQFAERHPFLELVNENSHAGNGINTDAFPFLDGILCSHGSGQTDEHPIEPFWNYVTYHPRRDGIKAATNYDSQEFESADHDRSWIPDEGAKTTDVRLATFMGMHARISGGGTFHSQAGVTSQLWNDAELAAATAFYRGIGQ